MRHFLLLCCQPWKDRDTGITATSVQLHFFHVEIGCSFCSKGNTGFSLPLAKTRVLGVVTQIMLVYLS